MKTAVSLPDELFSEAEQLAAELGTSRSQLYRRAIREFVARHEPDQVTAAMDQVISEVGSEVNAFSRVAGRRVLDRVDW